MRDFLSLIRRMGILRKYIFLLILRSPFDAFRTWMLANLMKAVFLCMETNDKDRLFMLCVDYGLICALLFLYNGTIWSIYAAFSVKLEARLQKKMLQKILNLSYGQVESRFSGEWITRLNSDIQAACIMMNGALNIPHAVVAVINTMLSSLLLFRGSFLLFGATWLFVLPHLFINHKVVLRHIPRLKEASQTAMAESTSAIKPLITEAEAILIYDAGDLLMRQCEESSLRLMKTNQRLHMRNAMGSAVLRLFGCGGYFVLFMMGYYLMSGGFLSFSEVVYCLQVRSGILAGMFLMITSVNNIKANSVCIKRVNRILEE